MFKGIYPEPKLQRYQGLEIKRFSLKHRLKIEMISMEEVMETRVKLLGSTALAAAAFVMAAPSVSAQDVDALEKRVQALEKAGGMYVTRTKKTMKLVVSGHINRHIQWRDDGTKTGITHTTSNFSRSRVRWIGTGKLTDDLSVQTYIELGNQSSVATNQDLNDNGDVNGVAALDERFIDLRITSKTLGKIYMGQGASGSESVSEGDLSGTGLLSLNGNPALIGGSEVFQTAAGASTGITVGGVFNNFDGLGRRDRIRYDTPKFAGFQVTASHGNADAWDVALRYGGSIGGVKLLGRIGYADQETINGRSTVSGSASILLPMGLALTVGAGEADSKVTGAVIDDGEWRYAKIGYKFKGTELGQTRLFIDWSNNEDIETVGDDATSWGIGVIQIIEPLGAELQIGYRNFDLDRVLADPEDVDIVTVGLRVAF